MKKIIRCDEVIPDPVIVTLGSIEVDAARISAYNTIRMLKLTADIEEGHTPDPTEAWDIICDIAREQGQNLTEEEILKAGTQHQVRKFVTTITAYILRTYKPLEAEISPSFRLLEMMQAKK